MATCSQCRKEKATYPVDNVVMCGGCVGDTERRHNVRRLKGARVGRINLKELQFFRRRVAAGAFSGSYFPALPVLAAAALSVPSRRRDHSARGFMDRTVNFVRRIFQAPRRG